ncbi:MAG: hypothetical protein NXI13_13905 [Proteobacteria bacterium]|nr:hypothetical protein [Pseudomonadota bacterium]
MTDNLELWNSVCETDPDHTKSVRLGGKHYTAIDPYRQIVSATAKFGPVGKGWGWEVVEVSYPPNDTVAVRLRLWHDSQDQFVEHWGQNGLYTDNAKSKADQDCVKKATTDGITKCLSMLGFNADVFLGKFDDNKYVQGLIEKKKAEDPEAQEDEIMHSIHNRMVTAGNLGQLVNTWNGSEKDRESLSKERQERLQTYYDKKKATYPAEAA